VPPSPPIYGRLDLVSEINGANGSHGAELVVLRPTARDMAAVFDADGSRELLSRFVSGCCRITNGTGQLEQFSLDQLDATDAAELFSIVTAIGDEAAGYGATLKGDGLSEPIVYDLTHPIQLSPGEEGEVIRQISFKAQKVGQISEFLDARGAEARFYAFMRGFGELLGTRLPMSDSIIGALDVQDYLIIVQHIMGKLTGPRQRWKRESTP